jgi:hypothetical protein
MRANDLEKGERLEKMFIGINGLINIEEEVLRTALNDVDTQNPYKLLCMGLMIS